MGAGVGYWNPDDNDGAFGPFSVRYAAAIALLEQLDPSPKAVEEALSNPNKFKIETYYKEKRLPAWFREGICSYAERWLVDSTIKRGGEPKLDSRVVDSEHHFKRRHEPHKEDLHGEG